MFEDLCLRLIHLLSLFFILAWLNYLDPGEQK